MISRQTLLPPSPSPTVGYGDTFPQTVAGRIIAIVVMLVGICVIAVLTAAAAERFLRVQREEQRSRWLELQLAR